MTPPFIFVSCLSSYVVLVNNRKSQYFQLDLPFWTKMCRMHVNRIHLWAKIHVSGSGLCNNLTKDPSFLWILWARTSIFLWQILLNLTKFIWLCFVVGYFKLQHVRVCSCLNNSEEKLKTSARKGKGRTERKRKKNREWERCRETERDRER